jgi:hypothetical protein
MRHSNPGTIFRKLGSSAALVLLCIGAASAQESSLPAYLTQHDGRTDPQSIPAREVLWSVFETVATLDMGTPGLGSKLLEANGLSRDDALAFSGHVRTSITDVRAHAAELRGTLCADTTALANSRDLLARSYQVIDAGMDARRDLHIKDLDRVLSPAGKERLVTWAEQTLRPGLQIVVTDHAKRFATPGFDLAAELAGFCGQRTRGPDAASLPKPVSVPPGITVTPFVR